MERLFNTTGKRLRILRDDLGLNQSDVADELNRRGISVRQASISKYEKDEQRPSLETVVVLAEILGTTTDYLLMATDTDEPRAITDPSVSYVVNELMEIYEDLSPEQRQTLLYVARQFRDANTPRIIE